MLNKERLHIWYLFLAAAVLAGIILRFYHLGSSGIFFYDEALYLNQSLPGLDIIRHHHLSGFEDIAKAFQFYLRFPLNFTKPIWIFIVDSRYLITRWDDWDYAKYAACAFGVLTLPLTFVFARRFFNSVAVACLSTAILALMPAHVFYSRLGFQETFSAFMALAGFYCYIFPRAFGIRTFLAGLFLAMAYLANYRLVILPGYLLLIELWLGRVQGEGPRWRHLIWSVMTFLIILVAVGGLMEGAQMRYTFAWIFHQQDMAATRRLWSEFLSYPYYLFRLENVFLALTFFTSIYLLLQRNWKPALPFVIVCVQMLIFSLASDRAARYIAVVLPFVAMASAVSIHEFYRKASYSRKTTVLAVILSAMFAGFVMKIIPLVTASSDYRTSVEYLLSLNRGAKFLSTQDIVQKLYLNDRRNVAPAPEDFRLLFPYYAKGFRYLVLDPQAYIGYTGNDHKWGLPLKDYLGFVDQHLTPIKDFPHFNRAIMERVVFEHSDDLFQSIRFMDSPDLARMSTLRVYDLDVLMPFLSRVTQREKHSRTP